MRIANKAEIDIEVAEFREYMKSAPTPPTRPDEKALHADICVRAFACGVEWANLADSQDAEREALLAIVNCIAKGFERGIEIRDRKEDSVLSATEISE